MNIKLFVELLDIFGSQRKKAWSSHKAADNGSTLVHKIVPLLPVIPLVRPKLFFFSSIRINFVKLIIILQHNKSLFSACDVDVISPSSLNLSTVPFGASNSVVRLIFRFLCFVFVICILICID